MTSDSDRPADDPADEDTTSPAGADFESDTVDDTVPGTVVDDTDQFTDVDEFDDGFDEVDEGSEDEGSEPDEAAAVPRQSRGRLLAVLVAVLVGAVVAGGVLVSRDAFVDSTSGASTVIGNGETLAENDFTRSEPGDCLQWEDDSVGEPSIVDCAKPHRFEVAGALDTSTFPTSEFADGAKWPGPERFAAIRDENCSTVIDRYLRGGLDPQGRFASGLMFPSKVQWDKGARVLRCGIEQPGANGVQEQFVGRVADIDQSFTWPAGTCVGIDKQTREAARVVVDCSEPHAFQTTGTVDLSQRFGDRNSGKPWPSAAEQNGYLEKICPNETNKFFGGAGKFEETTLNVQWSVISEVSWLTGSRRVACYVALPDRGGFATLVGDAREQVLINGRVPVPPDTGPPGRSRREAVPLPPGYTPDDREIPAPVG